MSYELVLPADFDDYAWEVEAKGVYTEGVVRHDVRDTKVVFYDLTRLIQDVTAELAEHRQFEARNVIVLPVLSRSNLETAVAGLPADFFAS